MEWTQFILFFIAVFGMFLWNRAEARNDIRYMDSKLESNRQLVSAIHKDTTDIIQGIKEENRSLLTQVREENRASIESIKEENRASIDKIREENKSFHQLMYQEMKDFHGRLCAIEERRLKSA